MVKIQKKQTYNININKIIINDYKRIKKKPLLRIKITNEGMMNNI